MARRVLCIHSDDDVRAQLAAAAGKVFTAHAATSLDEGSTEHGRSPFDLVLLELDEDATAVRTVQGWHPVPAVVTVGPAADDAVERAMTSGAHDHLDETAEPAEVTMVVERSWRRHRATRTQRSTRPPAPDLHDVRRRVAQAMSLTAAARELLGLEEAPHTTVRSLLDQAEELGNETMTLVTRHADDEQRVPLDLALLAAEAWDLRRPRGSMLGVDVDDVEAHGYPSMLRTALVMLFAHATRGSGPPSAIRIDTHVLPDALRIRVHDAGPPIGVVERRLAFTGDGERGDPMLVTVEHVAARHGGTAWLADSDIIEGGTMAVIELPRRATPRSPAAAAERTTGVSSPR